MKDRLCRLCGVWFQPARPYQHTCGCEDNDEAVHGWLDNTDLTSTRAREKPAPEPWNQPLFDHMSENYGLILLESEMHEIMIAVDKCRANAARASEFRDLSPEAAAVVADLTMTRAKEKL